MRNPLRVLVPTPKLVHPKCILSGYINKHYDQLCCSLVKFSTQVKALWQKCDEREMVLAETDSHLGVACQNAERNSMLLSSGFKNYFISTLICVSKLKVFLRNIF